MLDGCRQTAGLTGCEQEQRFCSEALPAACSDLNLAGAPFSAPPQCPPSPARVWGPRGAGLDHPTFPPAHCPSSSLKSSKGGTAGDKLSPANPSSWAPSPSGSPISLQLLPAAGTRHWIYFCIQHLPCPAPRCAPAPHFAASPDRLRWPLRSMERFIFSFNQQPQSLKPPFWLMQF